jgi:D-galactarolactone isomerase
MAAETPRLKAPPGTTDTHMHIYAPPGAYPIAAAAVGPKPEGDVDAYAEIQARLGLARTVVVQPTHYGADNRCTLDAIARLPDARGVAVVTPDIDDGEFERLGEGGIRGVRFQMVPGGMTAWAETDRLAARAHEFGWHAQLQLDGRELPDRLAQIRGWPGDLVIDHVGRFFEPVPVDDPAFRVLLDLVAGGRCWVKLSAPYIHSRAGPPYFDDVGVLAKALLAAAPERMLWASNWPHPSHVDDPPDDGMLLDVLLDWAPDETQRRMILVDNPAALYGFA